MADDLKTIKCVNVIRRALGEVVSGPVSAGDEVDPTPPVGSVDPRLVRLIEAADLYSAPVLRQSLDWLCQQQAGGKRMPFRRLGGRPVDLVFRDGPSATVMAAYVSDGTLYLCEAGGCRWLVRIATTIRRRRVGRADSGISGLCQRCGRDTDNDSGMCAACSGRGRSQINDQRGRPARAVRPVDLGDPDV